MKNFMKLFLFSLLIGCGTTIEYDKETKSNIYGFVTKIEVSYISGLSKYTVMMTRPMGRAYIEISFYDSTGKWNIGQEFNLQPKEK